MITTQNEKRQLLDSDPSFRLVEKQVKEICISNPIFGTIAQEVFDGTPNTSEGSTKRDAKCRQLFHVIYSYTSPIIIHYMTDIIQMGNPYHFWKIVVQYCLAPPDAPNYVLYKVNEELRTMKQGTQPTFTYCVEFSDLLKFRARINLLLDPNYQESTEARYFNYVLFIEGLDQKRNQDFIQAAMVLKLEQGFSK